MKVRNYNVKIQCELCGREYSFFVNKENYDEFLSQKNYQSTAEIFPYLMDEEIDLLETKICSDCA